MGRKSKWELEQDKIKATRKKALKNLTEQQLKALNKTYKAIENALHNIREIDDLYVSDVRELDHSFWRLKHEFNLGEK